jgi:hypothetical protein
MTHPPWWCLWRIACQVVEQSPARVDASPPRQQGGLVVRGWPRGTPYGE